MKTTEKITERVLNLLAKISREDSGEYGIRAFIEVYAEDALAQAGELAERIDRNEKVGKRAGTVFAVKNNIAVKGKRLTCGSRMLENYLAPYTATVVQKLIEEDAILIGSLNMDEFACGSDNTKSAFSPVRNPLSKDYVPGGSSGGSAAAVAANFVDFTLGSDTGGSIRCPASFCGVVSLKPTYGAVSRYGLSDLAMSFDQIGPIAGSVAVISAVLEVISGRDEKDQTTHDCDSFVDSPTESLVISESKSLNNLRIAYAKEFIEGIDPKIRVLFNKLITKLRETGYHVEEISIPSIKYAIPIYYLAVFAEFSSAMQKFDGLRYGEHDTKLENLTASVEILRGQKFGLEVKRRIMLGTFITTKEFHDAWYDKTIRARFKLKAELEAVFFGSDGYSGYDVLLGPTMSSFPWKIGEKTANPVEMYLADILTVPANIAGIPAGSVPFGRIGKFRPGFQVQSAKFNEAKVLSLMREIERLDSKFGSESEDESESEFDGVSESVPENVSESGLTGELK